MTRLNINDARCRALVASRRQQSEAPTAETVTETIRATVRQFGIRGCAGLTAQECGDHPEAAAECMRWARQLLTGAPPLRKPGYDGARTPPLGIRLTLRAGPAPASLGSRRRSPAVSSPVEISSIASSSSARGPRSPGTPSREYRSRMFSHRLATVCTCQPIRAAVCFADRGAAGPACRQLR